MRELKFRLYNKSENKMYYNVDFSSFDGEYFITGGFCISNFYEDSDNIIIDQYIGIKDKNDKEIYSNDIVEYGKDIYKVTYCNNYACCGYRLFNKDESLETECTNWSSVKIIGNIHENKDLL